MPKESTQLKAMKYVLNSNVSSPVSHAQILIQTSAHLAGGQDKTIQMLSSSSKPETVSQLARLSVTPNPLLMVRSLRRKIRTDWLINQRLTMLVRTVTLHATRAKPRKNQGRMETRSNASLATPVSGF